MALRPNILTDAALHIAFEASILLQYTDINLYNLTTRRKEIEYPSITRCVFVCDYHKEVNKGFERFAYIIIQFIGDVTIMSENQKS